MQQMISIVIPVYRAQETLAPLHERISAALAHLPIVYEIVFVEDAGGDRSWPVIVELTQKDDRVRAFRLSRNFGQHNALLCGIKAARGDVIVTMDDDLQHPPEELHKLLSAMTDDIDVVYGFSPNDNPHGLFRGFASRASKWALQVAMGVDSARHASAFRAFRTRLREAFGEDQGPSVNIDVMLTWGTTRFTSTVVRHDQRAGGTSGYTVRKLLSHLLNMVTGFTALPLQIASVMGILFSAVGFVLLIYVCLVRLIHGGSVPGFTFLASAISVLAGVQLFALGMIGEYVSRIHFRTMGRPTFVVSEKSECGLSMPNGEDRHTHMVGFQRE